MINIINPALKKRISLLLIMIILILACALRLTESPAFASSKVDEFLNDSRWKNGTEWRTNQPPKTPPYSGWSGCGAYVYDFSIFVHGVNPNSGIQFNNASEIRNGDIIEITNPEYGVHWIAVIKRDGNKLYTAEGAAEKGTIVRVGWYYDISANGLKETAYNISYSIIAAFHYNTDIGGTATTPCKTHTKGSFLFYEAAHPHYGYWSCSKCGQSFTDGTTTKVASCSQCQNVHKPSAPAAPTVSTSGSSVTVKWKDVANETSYDVYLVQEPWGWGDIKYSKTGLAANTTSHTFSGVKDGAYAAFVIARPNADNVQSKWASVYVVSQPAVPSITFNYDANGGTGTMPSTKPTYNKGYTLPKSTFKKQGYVFDGWNLRRDTDKKWFVGGVGWLSESEANQKGKAKYKDGATFPAIESSFIRGYETASSVSFTWVAQWKPITITFNYDANGGTGTMASTKPTYNKGYTLPKNTFTKQGYVFDGWNLRRETDKKWFVGGVGWLSESEANQKGKAKYKDGVTFSAIESSFIRGYETASAVSFTWVAQWIPAIIFNYDSNGGKGVMEATNPIFNQSYSLPKHTFINPGYVFDGWNLRRDIDSKWFAAGVGWLSENEANQKGKQKYKDQATFPAIESSFIKGLSDMGNISFTWVSTWKDCSHTWDGGKITKKVTCEEAGVKTFTCDNCGETKTESIAATGHSFDSGKITKEATIATEGEKTYTCTICKDTKNEVIPRIEIAGIPGDVNMDTKVNFQDVTTLLKHVKKKPLDKVDLKAVDVDGNGKVNFQDVTVLLKYVKKKVNTIHYDGKEYLR